ncbi:MAG: 4Fe-4S dicluster domain-containing protein, partial [Candidatus Zixiibacteriota bacterium]
DLPIGWFDQQDNGRYRLQKGECEALFGYTVGPHSWKKFLYPPARELWTATREGCRFAVSEEEHHPPKRALIGVRSCELHALAIQDKVLTGGEQVDVFYQQSRRNVFIVAVNCTHPGNTCFCSSMKTGPKAVAGFDLSLTEMIESKCHYFVVEVGSDSGAEMLDCIPNQAAGEKDIRLAAEALEKAASAIGRSVIMDGVKDLLYTNFDHLYWGEVANRCLTCGNCTMVCPTCFCVNVEDTTNLTGSQARRLCRWDSCFTVDFSYIHGGSIRNSDVSRYRQWVMHKLAYWQDQFGTPGCVGCGRCITWCPAGIDITETAGAFRKRD